MQAQRPVQFERKFFISHQVESFETGCFQAGVELAPPYQWCVSRPGNASSVAAASRLSPSAASCSAADARFGSPPPVASSEEVSDACDANDHTLPAPERVAMANESVGLLAHAESLDVPVPVPRLQHKALCRRRFTEKPRLLGRC